MVYLEATVHHAVEGTDFLVFFCFECAGVTLKHICLTDVSYHMLTNYVSSLIKFEGDEETRSEK